MLEKFDFIIVGGGTAGLVAAARLSEDETQTVLVVEAGSDHTDDPQVTIPSCYASFHDTEADWAFESESQAGLNGRTVTLNQGKLLGGSSAINAQIAVPPSKALVDEWESLGNPQWNWSTLGPYFRKPFRFPALPDTNSARKLGVDGWTPHDNPDGPVPLSFPGNLNHPLRQSWADTFKADDSYMPGNPYVTATTGSFSCLATIDPETNTRAYSASAYWAPTKGRPNLRLLTDTVVEKLLLQKGEYGTRANGVQFTRDGKTVFQVATKEVIVAAGAIQSPKLLELSGIGNPNILEDMGIELWNDLPGVGENLQDHILCLISYEAMSDVETLDSLQRNEPPALKKAMEEYENTRSGPLASMGIYTYAYQTLPGAREPTGVLFSLAAQAALPGDPDATMGLLPGKWISLGCMLAKPRSRGSTHIRSPTTSAVPVVDPRYFSDPADIDIFTQHMLHMDKIASSQPFSSLLKSPLNRRDPASLLSDKQAAERYVRANAISMWHYVGTCAMMPRDKHGVVDTDLKVHGIINLRVIDSSVIPLISTGNTQTSVYAIAERACDLIKAEHNLK